MLQERPVRQLHGEPRRRWFSDEDFDLFVFYEGRTIVGFQLCFDKQADETALTWDRSEGVWIRRVDTGEAHPFEQRSPVLTEAGDVSPAELAARFRDAATSIPDTVRDAVLRVLDGLKGER
ncbi:MAG: hypothetical protein D6761_10120 [Candidatus Dadabacteria bacterium]|nr:MAG: hypothetical protein D6761_10120 [Candidatus Dadabacteria bacterium]